MKSPKSVVKATIKLVLYVRDYKVDSPLNLHRTASYIFVARSVKMFSKYTQAQWNHTSLIGDVISCKMLLSSL